MEEAEKIAEKLIDRYDGQTFSNAGQAHAWLKDAISVALRSYGSAQREEGRKEAWNNPPPWFIRSEEYDRAYADGRRAGIEELEKIIPTRPEFNMLATITYLELQRFIRSLLSPEEKKK